MTNEYDSDSSGNQDIETGVVLGYASKTETEDSFSQLGGHPSWLDKDKSPPGALARCQTCNGLLSLLLQLGADLENDFPGHARALYIFACRRKACRRKNGSIRGLRYTNVYDRQATAPKKAEKHTAVKQTPSETSTSQPVIDLGNALFGSSGSAKPANANPFGAGPAGNANPFAPKTSQPEAQTDVTALPQTFAEKAKIAASETTVMPKESASVEPWPEQTAFPKPYPSWHIDADKEFLDPEPEQPQQAIQIDDSAEGGSGGTDMKDAFESSMDKTFQRFADRLSQNPEQVLRYEYAAQPLLYSKTDAIGKIWPKIPKCSRCGAGRKFELQMTPHAITELEDEDISLDGMDWGTIILATCSKDCEGWTEEWIGVQWEELASKKPAS